MSRVTIEEKKSKHIISKLEEGQKGIKNNQLIKHKEK